MNIPRRQHINDLPEIFRLKGIRHIIISSGSRNAPLIQAFVRKNTIKCISIVDERCAAYFALGLAKMIRKPVGLLCTSGTAVLNYSPAIAEAYYQNIPLIVLTADRPPEWIDQQDNQTIRQKNVYANYIKKSYQLPVENNSIEDIFLSQRYIFEAIHHATTVPFGPVHINIPLREPIYNVKWEKAGIPENFTFPAVRRTIGRKKLKTYTEKWKKAKRKMIICGMNEPNDKLNKIINSLSSDQSVIILAENISNICNRNIIECPEKILSATEEQNMKDLIPDLLITTGGHVVSRGLKNFLRNNKPKEHWRINQDNQFIDTYKSLTEVIPEKPEIFLGKLLNIKEKEGDPGYRDKWLKLRDVFNNRQAGYLQNEEYSELKIFELLLKELPADSVLHLGNSLPVRYSQYFMTRQDLTYYSNRGTSGIDGCLSTASGSAYAGKTIHTVILGDMSFVYDSNALWNNSLPPNLRIVVINNHGGRIFDLIEGASGTEGYEEFMRTANKADIRKLSEAFQIPCLYCNNRNTLIDVLPVFLSENKTAKILEIEIEYTDNKMFKDYINFIRYG